MTLPWLPLPALSGERMERVRRRAIFECCKWDPQIGDQPALASAPILLRREAWRELCTLSEQLAAELSRAERELLERGDLLRTLALPRALVELWRDMPSGERPASAARLVRFDFHYTAQGWRISEANTDVPGGLVEGSGFTGLMHEQYSDLDAPPDPAQDYAEALVRTARIGRHEASAALVHATAYTDDRQVMEFLGRRLEEVGVRSIPLSPDQILWRDGRAHLRGSPPRAFDLVVRFYPAEWLPNLPRASGWQAFARGARTPASNPATALIVQSKRFPLVWDELETPLPTWRALLPETRDPRRANWVRDSDWVLKPALGRVGEGVVLSGADARPEARRARRQAFFFPRHWVAQRRFQAVPMETGDGPRFPCFGVYTVDGRAAGVYARVGSTPLIDWAAQDAAVLLEQEVAPLPEEASGVSA